MNGGGETRSLVAFTDHPNACVTVGRQSPHSQGRTARGGRRREGWVTR